MTTCTSMSHCFSARPMILYQRCPQSADEHGTCTHDAPPSRHEMLYDAITGATSDGSHRSGSRINARLLAVWAVTLCVTALVSFTVGQQSNHLLAPLWMIFSSSSPSLSTLPFPPLQTSSVHALPSSRSSLSSSLPATAWTTLPSMSLMLRSYSGMMNEMHLFHMLHLAFWPRQYVQSDVVWVLDDESSTDHRLGSLIVQAYDQTAADTSARSRVAVAYEALPGRGILSDKWRGLIGYCRQQYSNFYSDLYTDRDYIAIFDSDAYFIRSPTPDDLFELTAAGQYRPLILGYNARTLWCASAEYMIGRPCAGEFMINFPVTVRREHFAAMRRHITEHLNSSSFEEAWRRMLTDVGDEPSKEYSQFVIISTYLWHYQHEEYAWRINSVPNRNHHRAGLSELLYDPAVTHNTTVDSSANRDMAARVASYNIPIARYAQHSWGGEYSATHINDVFASMCVASQWQAAECDQVPAGDRDGMRQLALRMWYTDVHWRNTERLWTSERHPNANDNADQLIRSTQAHYATQWRQYQRTDSCAAGETASGDSSGSRIGGPIVFRPAQVTYDAASRTFNYSSAEADSVQSNECRVGGRGQER